MLLTNVIPSKFIFFFLKVTPDSYLRATSAMWGHRKKTTIYESESWLSDSDIKSASVLILDFPASDCEK